MKTFSFTMLHGKVTMAPEYRETKNGAKVCKFTLCAKNNVKSEDMNKVYEFYTVKVFSKLADVVRDFVHRGDFLEVVGQLRQERWTDRQNNKRSAVVVMADRIGFLSYNKKAA